MMGEQQNEVRAVFTEALALSAADERARYLDAACRDKPELRLRVEALLRAREQAGEFLTQDALGGNLDCDGPAITAAPGTIIGRYKLLEQIGEGGFGVVFMAEQVEPIRRRVALKIVKPGMDTKEVIARFEAERQALALMDHPNIAHVFDAGATATGRPYFVMELVHGVPITNFCDANNLSPHERLKLFQTVCEAVQHAHQKGIIHRDLKPSNILVTLHDGKPVPKVIDFGTAKALQYPLTEKTLFTAYGKLIGTPQYMSPEQAELSGLDVDTRADIYSLGVLLYELLTGTTPFEMDRLRAAAFEDMLRIIRQEEPPKPSTRVSTLGERATEIAKHRQVDPALLRRTLRGDLDWIVMKTLEKDRARRYESASALLEDLQHHLSHEPVKAGPPSAVYRTRKFIRRHRVAVAFAAVVACALTIGFTASVIGFAQARRARDQALAAEAEAEGQRARAEQLAADNQKHYQAARLNLYAADMAAASRATDEGNLARASQLLEAHQPSAGEEDLRGVEWRCNWALSQGEQITTLPADSAVLSVAVSPDGKFIAAGCGSGTVHVWHLDSLLPAAPFLAPSNRWYGVAFSPDGKLLAACGMREARLWEFQSQRLLRILPGKRFRSVAFSPDGKLLVAGASSMDFSIDQGATHIYDGTTGEPLRTLAIPSPAVAFSRDGKLMATGHPINILDVATWNVTRTIPERLSHSFCFSAEGRELFVFGFEKKVRVWNLQDGGRDSFAETGGLRQADLSPDGAMLVVGTSNGHLVLWDAKRHRLVGRLQGHRSTAEKACFTPRGDLLVSGSRDGTVGLWRSTLPDKSSSAYIQHTYTAELGAGGAFCRFSPDGRWLAAPCRQGIEVVDVAERRVRVTLQTAGLLVGFIPGGSKIVAADVVPRKGSRPRLEVWEWQSRSDRVVPLEGFPSATYTVNGYALEPTGGHVAFLVITNGVSRLISADISSGKCQIHPLSLSSVTSRGGIGFSADNRFLAIGGGRSTLLCRWPEAVALRKLGENESVVAQPVFSPDSTRLAVAANEGKIGVWEVPTGRLLFTLAGQRTGAFALSFSPDNLTLAVNNVGSSATFWHLPTQRESMVWKDTAAVEFSPDGRTVAVVKADYGLYLLRMPTLQEIDGRKDQPQRPLAQLLAETGPGLQPVEGLAAAAIKRGDPLAEQGNFRDAAAAFSEGLQVAPGEAVLMYKHALSCLGMGDSQSWRKAVNGICETPGLSESGEDAGLALWACALAVDGFADYARVLDLARAAATRTNGANPARDVLTLGALLYRAGRYPEALQKLNEAAELRVKAGSELMSPAYPFYFLAMTQAELGHGGEAQDAFRRGLAFDPAAGGTVRATEPNPPWNRRLTLNLLRSEAERVLVSNPAR